MTAQSEVGAPQCIGATATAPSAETELETLEKAESFISGFEGDSLQEGIDAQLVNLRALIDKKRAAEAAKPAPLPLASSPLSFQERARWHAVLDPLLKYAGRPGDWGYGTLLGNLTMLAARASDTIAATPEERP